MKLEISSIFQFTNNLFLPDFIVDHFLFGSVLRFIIFIMYIDYELQSDDVWKIINEIIAT